MSTATKRKKLREAREELADMRLYAELADLLLAKVESGELDVEVEIDSSEDPNVFLYRNTRYLRLQRSFAVEVFIEDEETEEPLVSEQFNGNELAADLLDEVDGWVKLLMEAAPAGGRA